jgi:co-chaperonin GroES (HSP10)
MSEEVIGTEKIEKSVEQQLTELQDAFKDTQEQFSYIQPFGGRLLLKYLTEEEKNNVLGETTDRWTKTQSGLVISKQEVKINTRLDIGLILKVGTVYNYYKGEFANYTDIFKPGQFVLFERVSWTPLNNSYCMVPIDSVHCILENLIVGVDILKNTRRDENY